MNPASCPLCRRGEEILLWEDRHCRVIAAPQRGHPSFCRVILNQHVSEMTDLAPAERTRLMQVVWAVEEALRVLLNPVKINLASLGNEVPHLHWHVIPRFADDSHFPDTVWALPRREGVEHRVERLDLVEELGRRLPR